MSLLTREQYLRACWWEAIRLKKPRVVIATYGASHLWLTNSSVKNMWMSLISHKVPTTILVGLPHKDSDDHEKHVKRALSVSFAWPNFNWFFVHHSHAKFWIIYDDDHPVLGALGSVNLSDSNIFDLGCEVRGTALKTLVRCYQSLFRSARAFDDSRPPPPHPEWQDRVMQGVNSDDGTPAPSEPMSPAP